MARFNYSGVAITGGTGRLNSSLGGSILMKNGVVRNYTTPTNPQTADQTEFRALFSYLTAAWAGLSEGNRTSWESARNTDSWRVQDVFTGTSRAFSSAKALFLAVNTNMAIANDTVSAPSISASTPPATMAFEAIGLTSVTIDASSGTVAIVYSGTLADSFIVWRLSPPVSPGNLKLTAVKSQLRNIKSDNAVTPQALGTPYVAKFGAITGLTGEAVFYVAELINGTTGQRQLLASGRTIIVA